MAKPTTRQQLKDYSLRQLGSPVIDVNVDDSQVEDLVDDALQFFAEYHFDGVQQTYIKHQITSDDITNGYIDMDAIDTNIVSVTKMFPIAVHTTNMFDVSYQMALNDFFGSFTPGSLTNYTLSKQHLEMLGDILDPEKNIRFSRVTNKLYGDFDWSEDVNVDDYLVIEAYTALDPETYGEIYNDRLLKKYLTALIKRAWGNNLSKFEGVQLPGGVQFNGQKILDEAREEIDKIEELVQDRYELPPDFMVG
jgi:hypothetical protein